jgi:hypothetical protein
MVMRSMIGRFVGRMLVAGMLMAIVMHMHPRHPGIIAEAGRRNLIATDRIGETWTEDAKQIGEGKQQPRSVAPCPRQ